MAAPGPEACVEWGQKLADTQLGLAEKLELVNDIKNGIDIVFSDSYKSFLQSCIRPLMALISATSVQAVENNEHKLRLRVFEILAHLPVNETLRPYADELGSLAVLSLQSEVQETALVCHQICHELFKNYKQYLVHASTPMAVQCEAVIQFITKLYQEFPTTYAIAFDPVNPQPPGPLTPGLHSLKLLHECPSLLLTVYHSVLRQHVSTLVPLWIQTISLQGPDPAPESGDLATAYSQLRLAQARTLHLAAALLRHLPSALVQPHLPVLAQSSVHLVKTYPDTTVFREELLNSMKILCTKSVMPPPASLRDIADEAVLIGRSRPEGLRPIAIQMQAELWYTMRKTLSTSDMLNITCNFAANLHDPSLPALPQIASVKLLKELADLLNQQLRLQHQHRQQQAQAQPPVPVQQPDATLPTRARQVLQLMLTAYVAKLKSISKQVPGLLEVAKQVRAQREARQALFRDPDTSTTDQMLHTLSQADKERGPNEARVLAHSICIAARPALEGLNWCVACQQQLYKLQMLSDPPPAGPLPSPPHGLSDQEVRLMSRFMHYSVQTLRLCAHSPSDLRDGSEAVSEVLSLLAPGDFMDVLSARLPRLYALMLSEQEVIMAAQLSAKAQGHLFIVTLLKFLVDEKLEILARQDTKEAAVVQQLLRIVFLNVSAQHGGPKLTMALPGLRHMVEKSLKVAVDSKDPVGYLKLVRAFFKAVQESKAKREIVPAFADLVQPMAHMLLAMLYGPNPDGYKHTLLELCLMLPAELSALLPVMGKLMRPLVMALKGSDELVLLALKTLEKWVDSLNPEFLEPVMNTVMRELMLAMWALLKPTEDMMNAANNYGQYGQYGTYGSTKDSIPILTLQLLGKLGGRNRQFLVDPVPVDYRENPEHGLRIILSFKPAVSFLVPLDKCVTLAKAGLYNPNSLSNDEFDPHYRKAALHFLHVCLACVLNLRSPDDSDLPGTPMDKLVEQLLGASPAPSVPPLAARSDLGGVKTKTQLLGEKQIVHNIMVAVIGAAADERLRDTSLPFMHSLSRHFAMLFAAGVKPPPPPPPRSRWPVGPDSNGFTAPQWMPAGLRELNIDMFLSAVVEVLCDPLPARAAVALDALAVFTDTLMQLHAARKHSPPRQERAPYSHTPTSTPAAASLPQSAAGEAATANGGAEDMDATGPGADTPAAATPHGAGTPAAGGGDGGSESSSSSGGPQRKYAAQLGYPPVLDELMPRVLHCCWDDTWHVRLGGAAGLKLLVDKLPPDYLAFCSSQMVRALMMLMKQLPAHSVVEREDIESTMARVLSKSFNVKEEEPRTEEQQQGQQQDGKTDGPADTSGKLLLGNGQVAGDGAAAADGEATPMDTDIKMQDGEGGDADSQLPEANRRELLEYLARDVLLTQIVSPTCRQHMRRAAVRCLTIVATGLDVSVAVLTRRHVEQQKLIMQKFRLVPLKGGEYATGQAEALSFVLERCPGVFPLDNEAVAVLQDALKIAEEEDGLLQQRMVSGRPVSREAVHKLRVACMQVLDAATGWEEFRESEALSKQHQAIISMLFTNLGSLVPEVHEQAKRGLVHLVQHNKLPKSQLQTTLKPLLQSLATYKQMNMSILRNLTQLLDVLSDWFNTHLGEKIIEHLKRWLDPEGLMKTTVGWQPGEEIEMAAGMLNLFHKLPRTSAKFLETEPRTDNRSERMGLVVLTIQLEEKLGQFSMPGGIPVRRTLWSPFRDPLVRFMNNYPLESTAYFLDKQRMQSPTYFRHFLDIVRSDIGQPLLRATLQQEDLLLAILNQGAAAAAAEGKDAEGLAAAERNALHLMSALVKRAPDWLPQHPRLYEALTRRWRAPGALEAAREEERRWMAKCLLNCIENDPGQYETLVDVFDIFKTPVSLDVNFLYSFCQSVVTAKFSAAHKQAVVRHVVQQYAANKIEAVHMTRLIKLLLLPMLEYAAGHEQMDTMDESLVVSILQGVLRTLPVDEVEPPSMDLLRTQVLKLVTLVLRHWGALVTNKKVRKSIIHICWSHLRKDDAPYRVEAYMCITVYVKVYSAPSKIMLQVFVALLRQTATDSKRNLIRAALDELTPVAEQEGSSLHADSQPYWVRWTRKQLFEEASCATPQLLHLCRQVVAHGDLYFPHRGAFVMLLVPALGRVGSNSAGGSHDRLEGRKMSIDMVALVLRWEMKRRKMEEEGLLQPLQLQDSAAAPGAATAEDNMAEDSKKRPRPDDDVAGPSAPKARKSDDGATAAPPSRDGSAAAFPSPFVSPRISDSEAAAADGAAAAAAAAGPADANGPAPPFDDGYRFTEEAKFMMLNYLLRMCFISSEDNKTPDQNIMRLQTLKLFGLAIKLWPDARFRWPSNLDIIIHPQQQQAASSQHHPQQQQQLAQGGGAPEQRPVSCPAVMTGWELMNHILEHGSRHSFYASCSQVPHILQPCYRLRQADIRKQMCKAMSRMFQVFPMDGQHSHSAQEVHSLQTRILDTALHNIQAACDPSRPLQTDTKVGQPPSPTPLMLEVCCSVSILASVEEHLPPAVFQARFVPVLAGLLHRCAKEQAQTAHQQQHAMQQQQMPGARSKAAGGTDSPPPPLEYGTGSWLMRECMALCAPRGYDLMDTKKNILQSFILLLTGAGARSTEEGVFTELFRVSKAWLLQPSTFPGALTGKEAVLLLQRLATYDRVAHLHGGYKRRCSSMVLRLVLELCTNPALPDEQTKAYFKDVVRVALLGFSCAEPELRDKFFEMYNSRITPTLFNRLEFIVCQQDWEIMADQFWLKQALDLLLAILKEDEKVMLAPNSAQMASLLPGTKHNVFEKQSHSLTSVASGPVPPIRVKSEGTEGDGEPKPEGSGLAAADSLKAEPSLEQQLEGLAVSDSVAVSMKRSRSVDAAHERTLTQHIDVPEPVLNMMRQHIDFLESMSNCKVRDMMAAVREFSTVEPFISYHLWVLVFPIVWATLANHEQVLLAKPIINLLSKEYHLKQADKRPNVIQAWLEGISLAQPQPKIMPELIKFLAKTHNAWHIAVPLLESHTLIFPDDERCFQALVSLYQATDEEDVLAGLWRNKKGAADHTKLGLSLVQHGYWEKAEELLGEANKVAAQTPPGLPGMPPMPGSPPRSEAAMWAEQWQLCCKQLFQWDLLWQYSNTVDSILLTADSLWRLGQWESLDKHLGEKSQLLEETPQLLLIKAYALLNKRELSAAARIIHQAMVTAVRKWWSSPEAGMGAQQQLLRSFQQLTELQESYKMLSELELGPGAALDMAARQEQLGKAYTSMQETLDTWRLRTPNLWDSAVHWQDILLWRNTIYNTVIDTLNPGPGQTLQQVGYKDKAWSVNKLGTVCYKHGAPHAAIQIINNMYGYPAMEVEEAFIKIREQCKAYLDMERQDMQLGLNMLNATNLEYFPPHHRAEIFRLKGLFHMELEDFPSANHAYSTALVLCRQLSAGWLSWGAYCDKMHERHAASDGDPAYLEHAVASYFQAVRLGSAPARNMLPRLLHWLIFDNDTGVVGAQFDKAADINPWVWLGWVPQLLASLTRPEAAQAKNILASLVMTHPQAMYCTLRCYLLTVRETAQKCMNDYRAAAKLHKDAQANGTAGPEDAARVERMKPDVEIAAFDLTKELMEKARGAAFPNASVLEAMVHELGHKFVPKPEERLLSVITALLQRSYKMLTVGTAAVPEVLRKELSGVCKACFATDGQLRNRLIPQSQKDAFLSDLNPEGPAFPDTIKGLIDKLKEWRNRVQTELEGKMPRVLRLEDESRALRELNLADVEMPGQYLEGNEIPAESVVYIEFISTNVHVVRRSVAGSFRRLAMYGSDGHVHHWLVQTGIQWAQGLPDERMVQMLRIFNRQLDKNINSRKRNLRFYTPAIVQVWQQVRIIEDQPSYCTYGETYEVTCARMGREADAPIHQFKDLTCAPDGTPLPDPDGELKMRAWRSIVGNKGEDKNPANAMVADSILAQYFYKTLPVPNQLWGFRKYMCTQVALASLLCQMFNIGSRTPHKILIARDTGKVYQQDLLPMYNDRGQLERQETVPFRLTRNLTYFFTQFKVEGLFTTCMAAAAAALIQKHSNVPHVLPLFFKDDLLAWQARGRRSIVARQALTNLQLKPLVLGCVRKTLDRTRIMAPRTITDEHQQKYKVAHASVQHLVEMATKPENLVRMEATWHPWF